MYKNFTLSILIILLCSVFIGCREVNEPNVPEEPPVTEEPPIEDPPETFFEGPIVVTGDIGTGGMIGPNGTKISRILIESDLIFVGKVHREDVLPPQLPQIEITEVLKGATNENEALLPDPGFDGDINIYFLRKEGDGFVFTFYSHYYSTIPIKTKLYGEQYEQLDEIKLLLNAYKKNRELFSKAGKQDLINLFYQLRGSHVLMRVLDDLHFLLDENDVEFFATGLQSSGWYRYFTLEMLAVWIPKIEGLEELIANVLFTTPDIQEYGIMIEWSLLALGKYGDIKYKDIFFKYVNHPIDGVIKICAAIAIVQIQDLETLLAFVPYYMNVDSRESIISYLVEAQDNNEILLPVLYQLREVETFDHIIKEIDDIIASRTGD